MTAAIIITICTLLLIAYLFDLTFSRTRIPSVIFLLLLGWGLKQIADFADLRIPDFTEILPILGTVGLILIVLEGSLELELKKSRIGMIKRSFFGSILASSALIFALTYVFLILGFPMRESIINSIPFGVISSSIAIPSVKNLSHYNREFITYESSLSDIFGVLFFNFMVFNESLNASSFGNFGLQLLLISVISFVATIGLSFLLSKIKNHIKFVPIILLVILIYEIAKVFHLPSLLFILLFGLAMGNINKFRRFKWIEKFNPDSLNVEVKKFKELTTEAAFVIRALFFLLFGFLLETSDIINPSTFLWSLGVVAGIFGIRALQLKLSGLPLKALLFVAPRGLITILLFLSIPSELTIHYVDNSFITQVILLSALVMMMGLMINKNEEVENEELSHETEPSEPSALPVNQEK